MYIEETEEGVIIKIRLQPNASRDALTGFFQDALKCSVTSPPVDGSANLACQRYLSKVFHVSKSKVVIISGDKCRDKKVLLKGLSKINFLALLEGILK